MQKRLIIHSEQMMYKGIRIRIDICKLSNDRYSGYVTFRLTDLSRDYFYHVDNDQYIASSIHNGISFCKREIHPEDTIVKSYIFGFYTEQFDDTDTIDNIINWMVNQSTTLANDIYTGFEVWSKKQVIKKKFLDLLKLVNDLDSDVLASLLDDFK